MMPVPHINRYVLQIWPALALTTTLALASCSEVMIETNHPTTGATVQLADLSQALPTFHFEVDSLDFADMLARYNEPIELAAHVSLWRGDRLVLNRERAEIKVKGGHSRLQPLKSLGIKLDDKVDNTDASVLQVPALLHGHRLDELRSFRLRNGGGDFTGTMLKDLAYARMVAASDLKVVPYYGEPAAAFVNQEFYGLLNLRTEGNANALSQLLHVPKHELIIAELDGDEMSGAEAFDVKHGDERVFRTLEAAIAANDREAALALVDEASFVDFVLTGTMFAVWDWPYKNVRAYSVSGRPIEFCVFDFDEASRLYVSRGVVWHIEDGPPNPLSDLFRLAMTDDAFETRFWDRRDDLLASGDFQPEVLRAQFQQLAQVVEPVIHQQSKKYGVPTSRAAWLLAVERHIEEYELRYQAFEEEKRPR